MTQSPFNPPTQTSSAGGNGCQFAGLGMVSVADPPRPRPFPWPLPFSATQGAVGGAGGVGMAQVQAPAYYGPYLYYWPYFAPKLNGLPNPIVKV